MTAEQWADGFPVDQMVKNSSSGFARDLVISLVREALKRERERVAIYIEDQHRLCKMMLGDDHRYDNVLDGIVIGIRSMK